MNLPSEFDLIQMEKRAVRLDRLESALIGKRGEHSEEKLPHWIGTHFDEEEAAGSAQAIRTLVAAIRSLPR